MSFVPVSQVFRNLTLTGAPAVYISLSSTTTQAIPALAEQIVTYTNVEVGKDITFTAPSDILIEEDGDYLINYSAQLDKTMGGSNPQEIDVYLKVNGTAVPRSGTKAEINANQELCLAVDYILNLKKNDVLQVACFSPTAQTRLLAVPANPPVPEIPSIIANVIRIAS
jgi:hypothetical protein